MGITKISASVFPPCCPSGRQGKTWRTEGHMGFASFVAFWVQALAEDEFPAVCWSENRSWSQNLETWRGRPFGHSILLQQEAESLNPVAKWRDCLLCRLIDIDQVHLSSSLQSQADFATATQRCPAGENDLDPSDGWDVDFSLEAALPFKLNPNCLNILAQFSIAPLSTHFVHLFSKQIFLSFFIKDIFLGLP